MTLYTHFWTFLFHFWYFDISCISFDAYSCSITCLWLLYDLMIYYIFILLLNALICPYVVVYLYYFIYLPWSNVGNFCMLIHYLMLDSCCFVFILVHVPLCYFHILHARFLMWLHTNNVMYHLLRYWDGFCYRYQSSSLTLN